MAESRPLCRTPAVVRNQSPSDLIIEVFDDSDKVGADIVLLHGCSQSCMQNPVEGLPKVFEDMVEVLPVLEIFLTGDSWVKICSVVLLPLLRPTSSLSMIFSARGFNLFTMHGCLIRPIVLWFWPC